MCCRSRKSIVTLRIVIVRWCYGANNSNYVVELKLENRKQTLENRIAAMKTKTKSLFNCLTKLTQNDAKPSLKKAVTALFQFQQCSMKAIF